MFFFFFFIGRKFKFLHLNCEKKGSIIKKCGRLRFKVQKINDLNEQMSNILFFFFFLVENRLRLKDQGLNFMFNISINLTSFLIY